MMSYTIIAYVRWRRERENNFRVHTSCFHLLPLSGRHSFVHCTQNMERTSHLCEVWRCVCGREVWGCVCGSMCVCVYGHIITRYSPSYNNCNYRTRVGSNRDACMCPLVAKDFSLRALLTLVYRARLTYSSAGQGNLYTSIEIED